MTKINSSVLYKYLPLLRELLSKADPTYQALYMHDNRCSTYDPERALSIELPLELSESIALNLQVVADLVRAGGSDGTWDFDIGNEEVVLSKGKSNIRLLLMKVNRPETDLLSSIRRCNSDTLSDTQSTKISCQIDALALKSAIKSVLFAVASSDQKPILRGVSLKFSPGRCEFVGTDGYRLAYHNIELSSDFTAQIVLSQKTMSLLLHVLDISKGSIDLCFDEKSVGFKGLGELDVRWEFASTVLAGEFAKYDHLLSGAYPDTFECSAPALYEAVQQIGVVAKENQIIQANFKQDRVELKSAHVNIGEFSNEVPGKLFCKNPEKEYTLNLRFNFLVQILQLLGKGEVTIHLQDRRPILFTSSASPQSKYLLLPLGG